MRDRQPMLGLFDMHCHLLPGVDDGAETMDESLRLLEMEYEQGVRGILLTPHYRRGMFETPPNVIRDRFAAFRQAAAERHPDMELYLGWEYHANQTMADDLLGSNDFRIQGGEYILLEFSADDSQKYMINRIRELLAMDLTPIIAHIERYPATAGDMAFLETLKKNGVLFQVNADSVIGREGFFQKRNCMRMLKRGMVDFIGSDAHDTDDRIPRMYACARKLESRLGKEAAEQLMIHNPASILKG